MDTDGKFGGPYTLTLGVAPNNVAKVSVSATAQIGRRSMRPVCKPWYSLPTPTNTPVVLPEAEFCSYNLNVTIGQSFTCATICTTRIAVQPSTEYVYLYEAGANDPTTPSNWHSLNLTVVHLWWQLVQMLRFLVQERMNFNAAMRTGQSDTTTTW